MNKLKKLKDENDAVILAHYYVDEKIQEIADYVGDSFYLAQIAQRLENKTIVLAGVYFMGESIKILNPDKTVLLVDKNASCPMVDMISIDKIEEMKQSYDDLAVVTYINSSAKTKALSDVCVTSSNALQIVEKLDEKNIFFIPDHNLGSFVKENIKDKNIILNDGHCPIHDKIKASRLKEIKKIHPKAKILAHPECNKEVLELADFIGSTKAIIKEASGNHDEYIIVTEKGISYELNRLYKDKKFYYIDDFICEDMKKLSIEKLIRSLENKENQVFVDKDIARDALVPLERMLELGSKK